MSIFGSIKDAIVGAKNEVASGGEARTTWDSARKAGSDDMVDVEAHLQAKDGADRLNWRTSIVDLLKLVGVDPSYDNRKQLAGELGKTDYEGSAEDNIWLHKRTMQELAANGGRVPADMLD